jgi:pimeloyl-ACP methyl ester carboxylesterase
MQMAAALVNGTSIYYEDTGGTGSPILFSHGLLWDSTLFAPQIAVLKERYRCVCYDHRGQGRSADGAGPAIDMDTLALDAAALIETLGLGPVHFCGLSMGGFVGMRLAINRPALIRSLVLLETSADPEPLVSKLKYRALIVVARCFSLKMVAGSVMGIMFGQTVLRDPSRSEEVLAWRQHLMSNRRSIWRAVNGVIVREGVFDRLGRIVAPTLVVVGEEDVATVPAKGERIARAIRGAKLVRIPHAGHSASVEEPDAVTAAIGQFIGELEKEDKAHSPNP